MKLDFGKIIEKLTTRAFNNLGFGLCDLFDDFLALIIYSLNHFNNLFLFLWLFLSQCDFLWMFQINCFIFLRIDTKHAFYIQEIRQKPDSQRLLGLSL